VVLNQQDPVCHLNLFTTRPILRRMMQDAERNILKPVKAKVVYDR